LLAYIAEVGCGAVAVRLWRLQGENLIRRRRSRSGVTEPSVRVVCSMPVPVCPHRTSRNLVEHSTITRGSSSRMKNRYALA